MVGGLHRQLVDGVCLDGGVALLGDLRGLGLKRGSGQAEREREHESAVHRQLSFFWDGAPPDAATTRDKEYGSLTHIAPDGSPDFPLAPFRKGDAALAPGVELALLREVAPLATLRTPVATSMLP